VVVAVRARVARGRVRVVAHVLAVGAPYEAEEVG
jgi:hypothetical protein